MNNTVESHVNHGHITLPGLPQKSVTEGDLKLKVWAMILLYLPYLVFLLGLAATPNSTSKPYILVGIFLVLIALTLPFVIPSIKRSIVESNKTANLRLAAYANEYLIPEVTSLGFRLTENEAVSLLKRKQVKVDTNNPYGAQYLELRHKTLDWYLSSEDGRYYPV